MDTERLELLANLPLLLNSSLELKRVMKVSLDYLKTSLGAEASTIFLLDERSQELVFWAMCGDNSDNLANRRIPANRGIVGWVISNQKSELIIDTTKDSRFFGEVDKQSGFHTRNVICVPLTAGGKRRIGAVQILNRLKGSFSPEDLEFTERFSHQLALAIENARLFESLQEKTQKLATLDRRRSEMISIISHEFRTPCGLIQTSVDLLSSGTVGPETVEEVYGILITGAGRITRLVEQIKNISMVSEGRLRVKLGKIRVTELFESVSKHFSTALASRNLDFTTTIADEAHAAVGDQTLIFIVLQNLISNAIRYTADGGKIALTADRVPGAINFSVTDTGIGIESTQHDLIFEKFYEVKDVNYHESGQYKFASSGLGLGLATVKSILSGHGTGITLESELLKGSSFSFRLPSPQD